MFSTDLLLQAFGFVFIGVGLAIRLGAWKKWYWRSRGAVYGYIPLGLMFLLYSFYDQAKTVLGNSFWLFQAVFGVLIALGIWWSFRPPAFVKPAWVRWVETYPQKIRKVMEQVAEEDPDWEQHVASRETLAAWAKLLERKKLRPKNSATAKR